MERGAYSYRADPDVPSFPDDRPIIVFDGYCAFCSAWARFVLRFDRARRYRLLPAQTALGRALYIHYGLDPDDYQTNILIEEGTAWFKAEGSIRMVEGLGFPWSLAGLARLIPRALSESLYDLIARNRFRLFGRRVVCYLSDSAHANRFLG